MIQNMKLADGKFQVVLAPWVQQFMETKEKERYRVPDEIIQERLKKGIDAALYIYSTQIDEYTGKQYKMIETVSGKTYRVAVTPFNDPDEPLYTQEDIDHMGNYLLNRNGQKLRKLRDYAYFVFTINTWRRAGDNLQLTIGDVLNDNGTFKEWLRIEHEQKTTKKTLTPINSAVCDALKMYLAERKNYTLTDLLFPADSSGRMMTVDGMCLVFKRAAKALGITQKIGTHSLRKTGAYHYVKNAENKEEAEREVSHIFGHSSIQITRRYLMIEREELKRKFEERKLEVKFD